MSSSATSMSSVNGTASQTSLEDEPLICGLHHVNLLVPPQTLHLAQAFYAGTLGLDQTDVPASSKAHLAWFNIGSSGQQIHITSQHSLDATQMKCQVESPRHPCFKISSDDKLDQVQQRVWQLYERGGEGAPIQCDEPGQNNAGRGQAGDFPKRFFARDYAGNRLEFTV